MWSERQKSGNLFMYRLLVGFVLVVTIPSITDTALAQQSFDGSWRIEAVPKNGSCKRTRHFTVVIENGVIRNGGSSRVRDNIAGGLEASGRIRGSVQRNRTRVDVTGNLTGHSGSGDWMTAGRVTCSGRWMAGKSN
jgi:hypothetical protein